MSQSFSNCVIGSEVLEVARMPHPPPGGLELCQSRQAPGPFLCRFRARLRRGIPVGWAEPPMARVAARLSDSTPSRCRAGERTDFVFEGRGGTGGPGCEGLGRGPVRRVRPSARRVSPLSRCLRGRVRVARLTAGAPADALGWSLGPEQAFLRPVPARFQPSRAVCGRLRRAQSRAAAPPPSLTKTLTPHPGLRAPSGGEATCRPCPQSQGAGPGTRLLGQQSRAGE